MARRLMTLFLVALSASMVSTAIAQVPQTLQYQGRLTDADGNALTTSTAKLRFDIFDDSTTVNTIWSQTFANVVLSGGQFTIVFKGFDYKLTNALKSGTTLWVGTYVNDSPLSGRQRITSVLTAFKAQRADTATVVINSAGFAEESWTQVGTGMTINAGATKIIQKSLTPPTSGYVVAHGAVRGVIERLGGATPNEIELSLTDDEGTPFNPNSTAVFSHSSSVANMSYSLSTRAIFPVSAGVAKTVFLFAHQNNQPAWVGQAQIILEFFPTKY